MSEDWAAVALDVETGLGEAGADAFIVRDGSSTGDAWNPAIGAATEYACKAVFDTWNKNEIDGTRILATDLKILVSATSVEPEANDKFKHGSTTYSIINVDSVAPAGIAAMYILQARR